MAELSETNGVITVKDTNDRPRLTIGSDGTLTSRDEIGTVNGEFGGPATYGTAVFSQSGTVSAGSGVGRFPVLQSVTIVGVLATANTAPSGQALVFDVNKNGTTIFTTQGNRPQIGAGANQSTSIAIPDVTELATNDYLTVDIDQVGSGTAGADVVVTVYFHL